MAGTQRLAAVLSDLYPNYSSRILLVNLPPSLAWFVRVVKSLLCEVTANKIAIIKDAEALQEYCAPGGVPTYYTDART